MPEQFGDGLEKLADIPDELDDRPLNPDAIGHVADVIDDLAGGSTAIYVNGNEGIERLAVLTDGFTVRILMLTTTWKWRGPYTPDSPERWLSGRGYTPASEVDQDG